jgi:uncharacterized coiled-coil DUF342 family protein
MSIDITKLHELEQKILAAMTFITTHMNEIQKVKNDVSDLFKQITALRAEAQKKD